MEIYNLEPLICCKFGKTVKVIDCQSEEFLKPGENHCSTTLKLKLKIRRSENQMEEMVNLIGKFLTDSGIQKQLNNSLGTFKTELLYYEKLNPLYERIRQEVFHGEVESVCPEFYGSRSGKIPGSDEIDEGNLIILLEDLLIKNYRVVDREGNDLDFYKNYCI